MHLHTDNLHQFIIPFGQTVDFEKVATHLLSQFSDCKVWLFEGNLGAGKTTLIKALCNQLGVQDLVSSPTFTIIQSYETTSKGELHHIDLYRLNDKREALAIGLDSFVHSGAYCFIEWGSMYESMIDAAKVHIQITINDDFSRTITAGKL
jgi:tRNA threonylcarbamoyladenosine biosynthesis protein TsaE